METKRFLDNETIFTEQHHQCQNINFAPISLQNQTYSVISVANLLIQSEDVNRRN